MVSSPLTLTMRPRITRPHTFPYSASYARGSPHTERPLPPARIDRSIASPIFPHSARLGIHTSRYGGFASVVQALMDSCFTSRVEKIAYADIKTAAIALDCDVLAAVLFPTRTNCHNALKHDAHQWKSYRSPPTTLLLSFEHFHTFHAFGEPSCKSLFLVPASAPYKLDATNEIMGDHARLQQQAAFLAEAFFLEERALGGVQSFQLPGTSRPRSHRCNSRRVS